MLSDIEIAQQAKMLPITEVAAKLGIGEEDIEMYGRYKAKLSMDLIRRMGNNAAHTGKKITQEQAALCLENLYVFLDFVAYCYGENYAELSLIHI